ncbi:MAG: hypothetical protein R3B68_03840 [Phycisphaerales bacterium]
MPTPMRTPPVRRRADWRWAGARLRLVLAAAFACFGLTRTSLAQPDEGVDGDGGDRTQTASVVSEVSLAVDQFGLGDAARPGGWIGLRVVFQDNTDRPRDIVIQAELRDADGDRPLYERVVTSNPGRRQQTWLYLFLPFDFDPARGLRIVAREVRGETEGVEGAQAAQAVAGRLLGEVARVQSGKPLVQRNEGVLGIVGTSAHGLTLYGSSMQGEAYSPLAHERTEIAAQLAPLDMPDRWMGLAPYEVLVWSNADPAELGPDRARALREWIERGGHLVIVLSVENQVSWTTNQNNLLRDVFPAVEVVTTEGVDLEKYRPLITRQPSRASGRNDPGLALPSAVVVHTFEALASAGEYDAMPILAGPDGECVVSRRLVGQGAVSVVGMGVGSRVLSNFGLPLADTLWNRVLGWRGQFETSTRLGEIATATRGGLSLSNRRDPDILDRGIDAEVNLVGRSLAGVVLAFAVFGLYWVVAGPGGYALLKGTGNQRHAWLGFVGAAALFTAIAWGGATIIKPKQVQVRHVTIVDHVYGQDVDRGRVWASVLIPSYLGARVQVPSDGSDEGLARFTQALAPWQGPREVQIGAGASFPDARAYEVDARSPDTLRVPTRATVKQFQADWAGAPRLAWPTPVAAPESGPPITIDPETNLPRGVLTHGFPVALRDVMIVYVGGQTRIVETSPGTWTDVDGAPTVFSPARTWATNAQNVFPVFTTDGWLPGDSLDLHAAFEAASPAARQMSTFLTGAGGQNFLRRVYHSSFFHQLETPQVGGGQSADRFHRNSTFGLDLSRWLGQPCIIVMGTLDLGEDDEMAIPLDVRVGGSDRRTHPSGTTIVRWVYPLPASPPAWPKPRQDGGDEEPPI